MKRPEKATKMSKSDQSEKGRQSRSAAAVAEPGVDERAREIEQEMTDDERFSLIVSLIGAVPSIGVPRDKRIPKDVNNMSAGYTPGVPRLRGFNVQLAGGINLARDPRNGRNFEFYSEDPYHSAVLAAEQVNGIQSQGVVSTLRWSDSRFVRIVSKPRGPDARGLRHPYRSRALESPATISGW